MGLSYYFRILGGLNTGKIKECISRCSEASGKNKFRIATDMLGCAIKYGAGFHDYMIFEYYNMNSAQRKTYMTRVKNKKFISKMNNSENNRIFSNKNLFDETFKDFLGRKFIDLALVSDGEIKDFISGLTTVIAKPNDGECGKGIEKIDLTGFESGDEFVKYVRDKEKKFGVVEECLVQHRELSRLYPYSVNTMRMATVVSDGTPKFLYAVLKTGNNGKFVDNLENGGFACHVDTETGKVIGPAHTSGLQLFEEHPVTGVKFEGFEIPYIKEAVETVKKAAMIVPDVRYIGWDVAITEKGPAIIEGNNYAAYDFPQLPDRSQNKEGLLKLLRNAGIKI